jgi:Uma2 family endonuclease
MAPTVSPPAASLLARPVVLTYEDLRTLPEDGRRYEILLGELYVTPAPATKHQRISRNLGFLLHEHVTSRGLGEVLLAPIDVVLDPAGNPADRAAGARTVVEPDLVFVATDRVQRIEERGIMGAPDLAVEILSPSTEAIDRGAKQQLYARYGVLHYWLVDPATHTLTELVLVDSTFREHVTHGVDGPSSVIRTMLFPELAIDLAQVFAVPERA